MSKQNKRTIYLGLDYSDFSGGITEINRKMGLLDAEFKLAQEQIKNYGNETDAAGTKLEYLTQKIQLQEKKVKAAADAYNAAMSSQNASQKTIDQLDKKLLQERTTLEKLKGSLEDAEKETRKLDEKTKTFGDTLREVASKLGISSPLVEDIAKKFDGVSAAVGESLVVLAAVGKKLKDFAVDAASAADDLVTLSAKTGITTTELQKLQYASKFVDVEVSTMTDSIQKLTKSMDKSREGNKETSEAFRSLGIRVTDTHGQLKDANEIFYQVIDALGKMKNETERDAAAMKLFGKSSAELNPLIKAGSEELRRLGKEAEEMGVIMGEDTVQAYADLNDSIDRFNSTIQGLKNTLGMAILPVLQSFFDIVSSIPTPVLAGVTAFAAIVAIGLKVATAMKTMAAANALVAASNAALGASGSVAASGLGTMLPILLAIAAVVALITGTVAALSKATGDAERETQKVIASSKNASQQIANNAKKGYASGTDYAEGGRAWVGEAGPELVDLPRGAVVHTAEESERMAGGDIFNVNISIPARDIKEFNDIVNIVRGQRTAIIRGTI